MTDKTGQIQRHESVKPRGEVSDTLVDVKKTPSFLDKACSYIEENYTPFSNNSKQG